MLVLCHSNYKLMKLIKNILLISITLISQTMISQSSIYDLSITGIDGKEIKISDFKDKNILSVSYTHLTLPTMRTV